MIRNIIGAIIILLIIGALFGKKDGGMRPSSVEYEPGGVLVCTYPDGYVARVKSGGCPSL